MTPTVHSVLSPTRMYRYLSDPSGKTVVENVEGVADADCFSPRENEAKGGQEPRARERSETESGRSKLRHTRRKHKQRRGTSARRAP